MSTSGPRLLSELEGVCLGIIRKHESCTAYRVRLELKEAPSSHWRASAGSVYPLLARIEEEGFIETTSDKQDGRGRKYMTVSTMGTVRSEGGYKMTTQGEETELERRGRKGSWSDS